MYLNESVTKGCMVDSIETVAESLESWEIPQDRFKLVLNLGARGKNKVRLDELSVAGNQEIFWQVPDEEILGPWRHRYPHAPRDSRRQEDFGT